MLLCSVDLDSNDADQLMNKARNEYTSLYNKILSHSFDSAGHAVNCSDAGVTVYNV